MKLLPEILIAGVVLLVLTFVLRNRTPQPQISAPPTQPEITNISIDDFNGFAGLKVQDNPAQGVPRFLDETDKAQIMSEDIKWNDPRFSKARQDFLSYKGAVSEGAEKIKEMNKNIGPSMNPQIKAQMQSQIIHIQASLNRITTDPALTEKMRTNLQTELIELKKLNGRMKVTKKVAKGLRSK